MRKNTWQQAAGKAASKEDIEYLAALCGQGRPAEAEALARPFTLRYPRDGFGWKVLGVALLMQGHPDEAYPALMESAKLVPQDAVAQNNLALCLKELGRLKEAVSALHQAISLRPNYAEACFNLGSISLKLGDLAQAQASLQQATALKPNYAEAYVNLGVTLLSMGRVTDAIDAFRNAIKISPEHPMAYSNLLFCLGHDLWTDPQQLFTEHLEFGERFEAPLRASWPKHTNVKDPGRCLRVGVVSGDLHNHAMAGFLTPVLEQLAQNSGLSLHIYYTDTVEDHVTQSLRARLPQWHDVAPLSQADLADAIRCDGIDILLDLSGHTLGNRILTFARKPAPIQASWLGYLGTTGLQAMDYYLCDKFWVPPGKLDWQFTEKPAYLPAAVVFQPSELAPPVNLLPALENGHITFGSFNRSNKINASVIVLWAMLLRDVPSARMVLVGIPPESLAVLLESFAREGIERSRLTFYARCNMVSYLALHHEVDFCLDAFPFGGGATNAHAAWMGVPTLCLAGDTPASRFGATEMNILGLDGFIATSVEDYVAKGRYWAEHVDDLAAIRLGMRERYNSSALGQPALFAENFAALLRSMWQRWCSDLPAAPIEASSPTRNLTINAMPAPAAPHAPSEQQLAALMTTQPTKPVVEIISATKLSEDDFWRTSALGRSLVRHLKEDARLSVRVAFNNAHGLSDIFNSHIDQADDETILVFVHDDVWLDEVNFADAVIAGLEHFDVIGVAGNRRRVANQPAWAFIDDRFTWDIASNLSGRVSHGKDAFGQISNFGAVPAECELLDGVFLATKKSSLKEHNVRFDTQFDFHFYDMDFCRSAKKAGLRLGTWLINLTHQSGGAFGSPHWREKYQCYLNKWETTSSEGDIVADALAPGGADTAEILKADFAREPESPALKNILASENNKKTNQTPVHEHHNEDLLRIIPKQSESLIEIGCSSGALAREFKKVNPDCNYFGVDIDSEYTILADRYCDRTAAINIENAGDEFFIEHKNRDCWIFGDTLEHFQDPWKILRKIRSVIPTQGSIVACIPNAQHWSIQVKLSIGDFRYQDSGLLDRTHLRWFTRQTIMELFKDTGFDVIECSPRIFNEPNRETFLPVIGNLAKLAGFNPAMAIEDSLPLQYVIKAMPK